MSETSCRLSVRVASRTLAAGQIAAAFSGTPSRVVELGDLLSPRTRQLAEVAYCIWDCPIVGASAPEPCLDWVATFLDQAEPAALAAGFEIDVRLSVSSHAWQSCFAIAGRELRALGAFDAQLNVDLYIHTDDGNADG